MSELKKFVVCYDYGMGGLWATAMASSASQILERYPELTVFSEPADWMSEADFERFLGKPLVDVFGTPDGLLKVVLEDRANNQKKKDADDGQR